jgi:hypothetical protein
MNDPYSKLIPGDKGTVEFVDDTGTIFCSWDSGSSLGIVYGEDEIRKLETRITEKIMKQILAIRDGGSTNMLDVNRVQYEANARGFYDLVVYLNDHRDDYSRFILSGESER